MDNEFSLESIAPRSGSGELRLSSCNACSSRFGLTLTQTQLAELTALRHASLLGCGLVEFGESALRALILAFCDSPYIFQQNYAETIAALQDEFYRFRSEASALLPDDDIISAMAAVFNGRAGGDMDYIGSLTLKELLYGGDNDERYI